VTNQSVSLTLKTGNIVILGINIHVHEYNQRGLAQHGLLQVVMTSHGFRAIERPIMDEAHQPDRALTSPPCEK
jgi:hypothetical protein